MPARLLAATVAAALFAAVPAACQPPGDVPDDAAKYAEKLPPAPKLDPKNEHKGSDKQPGLLVELAPDPDKPGAKKVVRVLVEAEVCLREGPLEVLLCKKNTKEHEAILRTAVNPELIHTTLLLAGAKVGAPVQFVDPKSLEVDYKPASGAKINVTLVYRKDGKEHAVRAQEWIKDEKTKKPMAHEWVFAGSRFLKNPDKPNDPPYYCANNGEVIAISNFVDSMLDIPVEISRDNAALNFVAMTDRVPPLLSKVWVVFEPAAAKK